MDRAGRICGGCRPAFVFVGRMPKTKSQDGEWIVTKDAQGNTQNIKRARCSCGQLRDEAGNCARCDRALR